MNFFEKKREERREREEKYRRENPDNKPTKNQMMFKFIVGAYLLYLDYQMMFKDEALAQNHGWKLVLMIAAAVLFAAVGVWQLYEGFKMSSKGEFYDPNASSHAHVPESENDETEYLSDEDREEECIEEANEEFAEELDEEFAEEFDEQGKEQDTEDSAE